MKKFRPKYAEKVKVVRSDELKNNAVTQPQFETYIENGSINK